jgi:type III pantothenate kinase
MLIAVDIGNSRIKFGRFERAERAGQLPAPSDSLGLPHDAKTGEFDIARLTAWCAEKQVMDARWLTASVHRATSERLVAAVADIARKAGREWPLRFLTNRDVPLVIHLDQPDLLGIDRVVAAFAVNWVRDPRRAAVVADLGTATTVDLLAADGAFAGGSILPGITMSGQALAEHTDVLPLVTLDKLERPPAALAQAAVPAIESGLFWGAVGAIRELVNQYAGDLAEPPEVFLTGGASRLVAEALTGGGLAIRHVPNLVLAGIALVDRDF